MAAQDEQEHDQAEVYPQGGGLWAWRPVNAHGDPVPGGADGFTTQQDAINAADATRPWVLRIKPEPR